MRALSNNAPRPVFRARVRSSPKPRRGSPTDQEPLFAAPPGRVMVDELTEQSKLAREAAFELLLARAPLQAAALDRRHEQACANASSSRPPLTSRQQQQKQQPASERELGMRAQAASERRQQRAAEREAQRGRSPPRRNRAVASTRDARPTPVRRGRGFEGYLLNAALRGMVAKTRQAPPVAVEFAARRGGT